MSSLERFYLGVAYLERFKKNVPLKGVHVQRYNLKQNKPMKFSKLLG